MGALLTIFIALITGLITMVISWLVDAANNIVLGITDSGLISFGSSGNLLSVFEKLFTDYNLKVGYNFAQIIMYASLFLILLLTIFEVINSMTAGLQGEKCESPFKILARGVVTLVLELIIFGIPFGGTGHIQGADETTTQPIYETIPGKACYLMDSSGVKLQSSTTNCDNHIGGTSYSYVYKEDYTVITGYATLDTTPYFSTGQGASLMSAFGSAMSSILDLVFGSINISDYKLSGLGKWQASLDVPRLIVLVILQISLFKSVIQMAIVFIERYLSFAFYILMGPLAVACNATTKTKSTYHDWLMGILSQFLTIFVSLAALRMYLSCWNTWAGTNPFNDPLKAAGEAVTGIVQINASVIIHYCVCLALVGLVTNSEKIVNALGFKTIMNGDTARSWGASAMMFGRYFGMTAGRALRNGASLVGNNMLHSAAISSTRAGQTGLGNRALNFIDPYKNTQMSMEGNQFHKNGYVLDKQNGSMSFNATALHKETADVKRQLDTFNGAMHGETNIVENRDIVSAIQADTIGNIKMADKSMVMRDSSTGEGGGSRMIVTQIAERDSNGQLHNYTVGITPNANLQRGAKIVDDSNGGVAVFEVNSYHATTENGLTYYRLDKTQRINQSEYEDGFETGEIEGRQEKDDDGKNIWVSDFYQNAQDYNEQMVLSQDKYDGLIGGLNSFFDVSAVDAKKQAINKIKEMGIGKDADDEETKVVAGKED